MKLPTRRTADSLEVKMTPMIDVVFLLLIFFVWTSSFELPEYDLPSALAQPPPGGSESITSEVPPPEEFDEIVVRLLSLEGRTVLQLNGQPVADADALQQRLTEIVSLGVQPPVIVDPSDEITMDHAIEAYDAARAAGVDRVLFAAHP